MGIFTVDYATKIYIKMVISQNHISLPEGT